jgi:hypothetical protein
MTKPALAVLAPEHAVLAPEHAILESVDPVEALRRRLGGGTTRDHVVLDFLEDDLREARVALSAVAAYVANVEAALAAGEPSQQRLLSLALGGGPAEKVEYLQSVLASARRRLAQVAARM